MATDPKATEYMNYIMKHPKFQTGGEVDEGGFYTQADGSINKNFYLEIRLL